MEVKFMLKPQKVDNDSDPDHNNSEWIKYLINGNHNEFKRFSVILRNECHNCSGLATIKYRRRLFEEGIRGNIALNQLLSAWEVPELLRFSLQELFLEYIDQNEFEYILKYIKENGWTAKGIYNKHQENKNNRIVCIVGIPMN
jgi:hypothetical protein